MLGRKLLGREPAHGRAKALEIGVFQGDTDDAHAKAQLFGPLGQMPAQVEPVETLARRVVGGDEKRGGHA